MKSGLTPYTSTLTMRLLFPLALFLVSLPAPAFAQDIPMMDIPRLIALDSSRTFLPRVRRGVPSSGPPSRQKYIWPAQGKFTSGYGPRWGRMHHGIDIAAPRGTLVIASASGIVARSGWNNGGYGNLVEIRHRDGSTTRYGHNNRLVVRKGQRVHQGQKIAEMGSTGRSTGPHTHFEIRLPGKGAVNPIKFLSKRP